jgi:hypothetical protein
LKNMYCHLTEFCSPVVTGSKNGVLGKLDEKLSHKIFSFNCIIHQKLLWSTILKWVVSVVDFVCAWGFLFFPWLYGRFSLALAFLRITIHSFLFWAFGLFLCQTLYHLTIWNLGVPTPHLPPNVVLSIIFDIRVSLFVDDMLQPFQSSNFYFSHNIWWLMCHL